ncbi:MAG: STAS domain-containing protein [Syntrophales bacterium]|nr:STAS domain-containing protein [Syntrophales bacterium]
MEIQVSKMDRAAVLALTGRMDALAAPKFDAAMEAVITEGKRRIIIDLAHLEYISSAGLQSILAAAKRLEPLGGVIELAALQGAVYEVFAISGFTSIFTIYPSLADALGAS